MAVKRAHSPAPAPLVPKPEPYDHAWFKAQGQSQQRALLIAWFAAIEAGVLDPLCSTLGQRLELVQCLAGIETNEAWIAKIPKGAESQRPQGQQGKAGSLSSAKPMSSGGLSLLLNGKRGKAGRETTAVTRRSLLGLLQAAQVKVDLPWIVFGSKPWSPMTDYWQRLRWVLELDRRSVLTLVQEYDMPRELTATAPLEEPTPDGMTHKAEQMAFQLAGGLVSVDWIRTGHCQPPQDVLALAKKVLVEVGRAECSPDSEKWAMAWPPSLLTPLLALVLRHRSELPDALGERIVNQLLGPFEDHLNFAPVLLGVGRSTRLNDQEIRDLRCDMLLSIGAGMLGDVDEQTRRIASERGLIQKTQVASGPASTLATPQVGSGQTGGVDAGPASQPEATIMRSMEDGRDYLVRIVDGPAPSPAPPNSGKERPEKRTRGRHGPGLRPQGE